MNAPVPTNAPPLTQDISAEVLLRITSAIETAATLDELLMLALGAFAELMRIPLCGVVLMSDDHHTSRLVSTYPPRINLPPSITIAETTFLKRIVATRQAIQISGAQLAAISTPIRILLDAEAIRSLLLIPLIAQDQLIGTLAFAGVGESRSFSDHEIAVVRLLAGQLAAAITSFRTTEKAQRRRAEIETLNNIAAAVTSSLDTRKVYHLVVEKLNEYFQVDAGSLLMIDDETGDLIFVMTLEAGEEKLNGVRVPRGQGVVGYAAETQTCAIITDPNNDPRFYPKISDDMGYRIESILCVPMIVKGHTIGVIELLNKRDGPFTEDDGQRLSRMAATIGVAIENARLFEQVATVRDRLEAILNSTGDGILMADMHGIVVTANPAAARLCATIGEPLIGESLDQLVHKLQQDAIEIDTPAWLNDGQGSSPIIEMQLPGRRFLRYSTLPVRDSGSAEIGRLALLEDIGKERELAQMRDDYTGMLVHDLRAPLTAIMNGVLMVRRGMGGTVTTTQQELLTIAYQASQTMLEMVNTLLDIGKMEQGRMQLEIEAVSPYALIELTNERLGVSAKNHHVSLVQQFAPDLPTIDADREKMVRVLQNLLDNAIKFSPHGSEVLIGAAVTSMPFAEPTEVQLDSTLPTRVALHANGDWITFWVRDQGPGIPPQYHERIFEKFGQVQGRKIRGTGLGLTFCKLTIEAHGGHIWLESKEGAGSIFAVALPIRQ